MATKIDWKPIEDDLLAGMTIADASKKYYLKVDTIGKHVRRTQLPIPNQKLVRNLERKLNGVVEKAASAAVEKVVDNWLEKGNEHRRVAFEKAHESIKLFEPKSPKSFRELEAADKVARRAAGLETAEMVQQTLINVNERIEDFDDEVVEATVVDSEGSAEARPAVSTG
jgi:hypothetical protein